MDAETTARRFYEAMNTGSTDLLDSILSDDYRNSPLPPGVEEGRENYKSVVAYLHTIFPDFTLTIDDIVVSSDGTKVAVRSTVEGTQGAELLGIPATGKTVTFQGYDFHRLDNGVIVQSWHVEDFLGVAFQLGAELTPPRS